MARQHYVDNKRLFKEICEYKKLVAKAKKKGQPSPAIPEYIGECILAIATRLSTKPNFINYSFREDMISDAVENVLLYLNNFNPEKSQNPFAYFTQITHYAFIRRIEREKKHQYTKYKWAIHKAHLHEDHTTLDGDSVATDTPWASYDNVQEFVRSFEMKLRKNAERNTKDRDEEDVVSFDILDDRDQEEVSDEEALPSPSHEDESVEDEWL